MLAGAWASGHLASQQAVAVDMETDPSSPASFPLCSSTVSSASTSLFPQCVLEGHSERLCLCSMRRGPVCVGGSSLGRAGAVGWAGALVALLGRSLMLNSNSKSEETGVATSSHQRGTGIMVHLFSFSLSNASFHP